MNMSKNSEGDKCCEENEHDRELQQKWRSLIYGGCLDKTPEAVLLWSANVKEKPDIPKKKKKKPRRATLQI